MLLGRHQLTHGLNLGLAGCVKLPLLQSRQVAGSVACLHPVEAVLETKLQTHLSVMALKSGLLKSMLLLAYMT